MALQKYIFFRILVKIGMGLYLPLFKLGKFDNPLGFYSLFFVFNILQIESWYLQWMQISIICTERHNRDTHLIALLHQHFEHSRLRLAVKIIANSPQILTFKLKNEKNLEKFFRIYHEKNYSHTNYY